MKSTLSTKINASLLSLLFLTMSAFAATNDGDVKSSSTGAPKEPVYEVLDAGTKSLLNGDFDDARDQYYAAYLQYPLSKDAILYSALADIVAISADPSIISLMQDRFGVISYRGIADLVDPSLFLKSYRLSYTNEAVAYPALSVPSWFKATKAYQDSLYNGQETEETWFAVFAANLIDRNDLGFNHYIDDILESALGDSFEDIASRIAKLNFNDNVVIDQRIIEAFNEITDIDIPYGSYGRAELEAITISLRFLKASLEWYASYNWDTDLSFLKTDWYDMGVDVLDTLTDSQLPFKNSFLTDRNNGMMSKSKASFSKALKDSAVLIDYYADNLEVLGMTEDDLSSLLFVRYSLELTGDIISDGDILLIPTDITELDYDVGIDFGKLFTPGFLALNKFIAQDEGKSRPRFVDQYLDPVVPQEGKRAGFEINLNNLIELAPGLWDNAELFDDFDGKLFLEFTPEVAQKLYKLYY